MQPLSMGKYHNLVHKSQIDQPERPKNLAAERVQFIAFIARIIIMMFALNSVQLGLIGGVSQRKVCGPRNTNG